MIPVTNSVSKSSAKIVKMTDTKNIVKPKKKKKNGKRKRNRGTRSTAKSIKERQKKFRDEHKEEYYACEICEVLIKNHLVHEKSEYHRKNLNNGWKDEKEKKWQNISTKIIRM